MTAWDNHSAGCCGKGNAAAGEGAGGSSLIKHPPEGPRGNLVQHVKITLGVFDQDACCFVILKLPTM